METSVTRLDRFKDAQNSRSEGFESALAEMRTGRKTGHWIWYVFPQISGLGTSGTSRTFGIDGEAEAMAFLRDPELRSRYLAIAQAVAERLRTGTTLRALMASDIDARKVVSSLTLFRHAARKLYDADSIAAYDSVAEIADEVLATAATQGYPPCADTLQRLRGIA